MLSFHLTNFYAKLSDQSTSLRFHHAMYIASCQNLIITNDRTGALIVGKTIDHYDNVSFFDEDGKEHIYPF